MYAPILQTAATYVADGRTAVWRVPFPYRTPADVGVKTINAEGIETVLTIGRDCMLRGFDLHMFVPAGQTLKIWLKAAVPEVLPFIPDAGAHGGDGETPACRDSMVGLGPVYCPPHHGPFGCVPPPAPLPMPPPPCHAPAGSQTHPPTEARYCADGHTARWRIPFVFHSPDDVGVKLVDRDGLERFLTAGTDYMVAGQYVYTYVARGLTVVIWRQTCKGPEQVPGPCPPPGDVCAAHLVPPPLDPAVAWLVREAYEVKRMQDRFAGEFQAWSARVLDEAGTFAAAAAQSETAAAASAAVAETATHYLFNHGVLGYQTKALLDADLEHDANVLAFVTNDPTPANNNWYIKTGESGTGAWVASDFSPATSAEAEALRQGKANRPAAGNFETGNLAKLTVTGDLADSHRSADDFVWIVNYADSQALELVWQIRTSMDIYDVRDKIDLSDAEPGNFVRVAPEGRIRDSGHSANDFVGLTAYADGEAQKLTLSVKSSLTLYGAIDTHELDALRQAGLDASGCYRAVQDMIAEYEEATFRHKLMQRLLNGTNPTASSRPVLFVISGQSNAVGTGAYTPYDRAEDCGWYWKWRGGTDALRPITDPIGSSGGYGSGWCAFAKEFFALTGRKVILLSVARGGSAVTDGGYTTSSTWADNGYGTLRTLTQGIWDDFSAAVPAAGYDDSQGVPAGIDALAPPQGYDVGGILWDQGGTDEARMRAGRITFDDYEEATYDIWDWTRTMIGASDCLILVALMEHHRASLQDPALLAHRSMFIDMLRSMCITSEDPNVHLGFTLAPMFRFSTAYSLSPDGSHYSRHGYKMQGEAFARSAAHYLRL